MVDEKELRAIEERNENELRRWLTGEMLEFACDDIASLLGEVRRLQGELERGLVYEDKYKELCRAVRMVPFGWASNRLWLREDKSEKDAVAWLDRLHALVETRGRCNVTRY